MAKPVVLYNSGKLEGLSGSATGNALTWNGTDWVAGAVNLAGGAGYVTGTLPIANGGTGNGATVTINTVFAGPSSGVAGAPLYRSLVVADLPTSGIPASSISSIPYDIAGAAAGTLTPTTKIFRFVAVRNATIQATGHRARCATAPATSTTFTVYVNGASIGTFTFTTGQTSITFSLTQTSLVAGDSVEIETGASLDGLVDPFFTLFAVVA